MSDAKKLLLEFGNRRRWGIPILGSEVRDKAWQIGRDGVVRTAVQIGEAEAKRFAQSAQLVRPRPSDTTLFDSEDVAVVDPCDSFNVANLKAERRASLEQNLAEGVRLFAVH